ncbi:hypothetical protein AYO45_00260 [Gammaproteobacteria bacterium SCGC AG-212-F23]|nr:hypothetical protein AYO45_00260 [Gammaproteobacteria bacterium SCGC AG-212-F23]
MSIKNYFYIIKSLFFISFIMLLGFSINAYAKNKDFHSSCFDISLADNLNLIEKTEEKNNGFYRYIFSSANNENAALQMRVIVSNKKPEANQSLEDFQTAAIGAMTSMFMDSYKLYQYINTPENKKVLSEKPYQLKLGNTSLTGATMYFGNIDASFLVTRANNMTYAFTLVSKNNNAQIRKNNLKALTEQLQSIKFYSCFEIRVIPSVLKNTGLTHRLN